jgi:hypothetical protein
MDDQMGSQKLDTSSGKFETHNTKWNSLVCLHMEAGSL